MYTTPCYFNDTDNINGTEFVDNDTSSTPCLGGNRGGQKIWSKKWYMGFKTPTCGHCDVTCTYSAIEMAFVIGVIANGLVIFRVARDKNLRDPTFVGIAALALADLLFLTLNLTVSFETVIITFTCEPRTIVSRPWYILNSMTWFAANSHVALLAVIRYLTIVYPIKSTIYLTPKKVMMMSAGCWALVLILMGILASLITAKIVIPGPSGEFIITWWITVYLIPLVVTTICHILKITKVKKATKDSANVSTRRSLNRMAKIVPLVIIMATVLPLPRLIFNCFRWIKGERFLADTVKTHFKGVSHLVYLINHFINPFIYGFLSKKFRKSLKDMFPCLRTKSKGMILPSNSPLSPRKRVISSDTVSQNLSSVSSYGYDNSRQCYSVSSIDSDNSKKQICSISSYGSEESYGHTNNVNKGFEPDK